MTLQDLKDVIMRNAGFAAQSEAGAADVRDLPSGPVPPAARPGAALPRLGDVHQGERL